MSDNRKRVPNFVESEITALTSLVKKYEDIIENKKTDHMCNKSKEEAWEKIAFEFNATAMVHQRDAKVLKSKYENMKKALKKKYGEYRRSLYTTGGGPPIPFHASQSEEAVMAMLDNSMFGLPPRNDSDSIQNNSILPEETTGIINTQFVTAQNVEVEVDGSENIVEPEEMNVGGSQTITTPLLLRRRKATPLSSRRRHKNFNETLSNFDTLTSRKQVLLDLEIEEKKKQAERNARQEEREIAEHKRRCRLLELKILENKVKLKKLTK